MSGSTKEVYETGSQVADLYLSLSTLADPIEREGCLGNALRDAIYSARLEAFPDLAREMGLEVLSPRDVGKKSSSPCIDEEVRYFTELLFFIITAIQYSDTRFV